MQIEPFARVNYRGSELTRTSVQSIQLLDRLIGIELEGYTVYVRANFQQPGQRITPRGWLHHRAGLHRADLMDAVPEIPR